MSQELGEIYKQCVECKAGCSGIVNEPSSGLTPRGFWVSERVQLPLQILVVGKNPGNASPASPESREAARLQGRPAELRDHVIAFAEKLLEREEAGFHRNLRRILAQLLPPGDWRTIERSVAVTELAKCQGIDEQGRIPNSTIRRCFDAWLVREIEIFQPRMILALGREAESGLMNLLDEPWSSRVVYCYHPSWGVRNLSEIEVIWLKLRSDGGRLLRPTQDLSNTGWKRKPVPTKAPVGKSLAGDSESPVSRSALRASDRRRVL